MVETETSLKKGAIGHELQMLYVNPTRLHTKVFDQAAWNALLDGLFAHFVYAQVCAETLATVSKNEKRILWSMNRPEETIMYTSGEAMELMHRRVELSARL